MLASVAEQVNLSLTSSEPPEDTFSHGEAQMENLNLNLKKSDFVFFDAEMS